MCYYLALAGARNDASNHSAPVLPADEASLLNFKYGIMVSDMFTNAVCGLSLPGYAALGPIFSLPLNMHRRIDNLADPHIIG